MSTVDKELEFNVLSKISYLYRQKSDDLDILNGKSLLESLNHDENRHACTMYCHNNTNYEFCNYCDDKYKNTNHQLHISGKKEPEYSKQFNTNDITNANNNNYVDKVIFNDNDLIPFNYSNLTPTKTVEVNGKKYNIYAPYIVIKGE